MYLNNFPTFIIIIQIKRPNVIIEVDFYTCLTRFERRKYSQIDVQKQRLRASGRSIDQLESLWLLYIISLLCKTSYNICIRFKIWYTRICALEQAHSSCALRRAHISAGLSKASLIDFMLQRCRKKSSQPLPLMLSSSPIALRIAFEKCIGCFTKALSVLAYAFHSI